jgi:hypothetical protein
MSQERSRCIAQTKAGARCKNKAQEGSVYCHVHQRLAAEEETAGGPSPAPEFDEVVQELNELAAELQAEQPAYTPPPFSPQTMLRLLRQNMDRFTPAMQRGILRELQTNLQGASPGDMLDPDTWKGMWFLLHYMVQNESTALRERINARLADLPGGETLVGMQSMLEGASPKDFLDVETWRGMWFLLNYSLQSQAEDMKRRFLGSDKPEM